MRHLLVVVTVLLLTQQWSGVQCGRGGGGSRSSSSSIGRSSSSRGSSSSGGGWFSSKSRGSPAPASRPSSGWYGSAPKAPAPVSRPSTGWFGSKPSAPKAPAPAPKPSYGWTNPSQAKPAATSSGWFSQPKPAYSPPKPAYSPPKPATGFSPQAKPAALSPPNPGTGWATQPKPAAPKTTYGWTNPKPSAPLPPPAAPKPSHSWPNPSQAKASAPPVQPKPAAAWPQPSAVNKPPATGSNIGPGGYPVQAGVQKNSPSYSPTNTHANPPPYSPTNTHSTNYNPNSRVSPPGYSQTNPHAPPGYSPTNTHHSPPAYSPSNPVYNGPKKQIINNHYHYGSSPGYSQPSHYGMSSSYYPTQNNFGYPSGGSSFFGTPRYNGMGLFGGGGSYGYSGSGGWGQPSYGFGRSSSGPGIGTGLLVGAVGGYLTSSLINRFSNNYWGYPSYGHGYYDRYRPSYYERERERPRPAEAPTAPPAATENNWINCVAYDPTTKSTLINPNCTCTVTVVTDPATGVNTSHHDCTPYQAPPPGMVQQQPLPQYGVNNPPPTFTGAVNPGGLYGGYGGAYGYGNPAAPGQDVPLTAAVATVANSAPPVVHSPPPAIQPSPETRLQSEKLEGAVVQSSAPVVEALPPTPPQGAKLENPIVDGALGVDRSFAGSHRNPELQNQGIPEASTTATNANSSLPVDVTSPSTTESAAVDWRNGIPVE